MSTLVPDVDLLRAYFYGELPPEEEAEVRRWLVLHADPGILAVCDELVSEREQRREFLASSVANPLRARLERAFWQARSRLGTRMASLVDVDRERQLALAPLSGPPVEETLIPARLEHPIYLRLKLSDSGHVCVYAIESWRKLSVLWRSPGVVQAGEADELPGFVLERPEDVLDLYLVLDTAEPPPSPDAEDGPEWLAKLLQRTAASPTAWVLRRTFVPAGTA
ncbi:hypothetical protein [Corallococcus llansteffanensis]|uniref:Uncharacterized protein n=1 Tax=Corallococcus llansteffanensis TaxID=2316731 RepID=A0A3A8PEF8_9BACT|nr:hypothetical protein [Corallococcus llansteffanensis]RKH54369.1 hypothetical protein D7V93_25615 [Corallococcus llansteffanensis]